MRNEKISFPFDMKTSIESVLLRSKRAPFLILIFPSRRRKKTKRKLKTLWDCRHLFGFLPCFKLLNLSVSCESSRKHKNEWRNTFIPFWKPFYLFEYSIQISFIYVCSLFKNLQTLKNPFNWKVIPKKEEKELEGAQPTSSLSLPTGNVFLMIIFRASHSWSDGIALVRKLANRTNAKSFFNSTRWTMKPNFGCWMFRLFIVGNLQLFLCAVEFIEIQAFECIEGRFNQTR